MSPRLPPFQVFTPEELKYYLKYVGHESPAQDAFMSKLLKQYLTYSRGEHESQECLEKWFAQGLLETMEAFVSSSGLTT
jgi:hypothetical protein